MKIHHLTSMTDLHICHFAGEVLTGRISCRKDPDDCRSLIVTFDIEGETLTYYVR